MKEKEKSKLLRSMMIMLLDMNGGNIKTPEEIQKELIAEYDLQFEDIQTFRTVQDINSKLEESNDIIPIMRSIIVENCNVVQMMKIMEFIDDAVRRTLQYAHEHPEVRDREKKSDEDFDSFMNELLS